MKVRSLSKLGYIAVFAVITTGCIGTTTPATHVTATSATLNGDGTTSEVGTEVKFEYGPTAGVKVSTPTTNVEANVMGPFRTKVTGLTPSTAYEFRICGRDIGSGGAFGCASWETFTTPAS